jgi:exopolysaccharide/PEP-CTERM locus tyrosine autokinase
MSIVEKAIGKLRSEARAAAAATEARRRTEPPAPLTRPEVHVERTTFAAPRPVYADDCVSSAPPLRINIEALRAAGALPDTTVERQLADEYRRIKWPVLERAFGREGTAIPDGTLVMVTSALPGDGKTFTSLNLALSIARERDSSVLLIDADVAKAHLTELLGIRARPGLTDLLKNPALDPASVIQATDVDGLRVMAAGQRHDSLPEMMASQRMRDLIAQLAARNRERVIIFDSSPLLATNESQVLAKLVGQVLVVVRANGTPRPAVEEAVALLDRSKHVGLVLNQLRTLFGLGTYYAGHYNYGGSQS